jgi:hypothetical protein
MDQLRDQFAMAVLTVPLAAITLGAFSEADPDPRFSHRD